MVMNEDFMKEIQSMKQFGQPSRRWGRDEKTLEGFKAGNGQEDSRLRE
jgi:hypothetical protein